MKLFVMVVGFTILLEGILPFFAPKVYRTMVMEIAATKPVVLRLVGLGAILAGLLILYSAKEFL